MGTVPDSKTTAVAFLTSDPNHYPYVQVTFGDTLQVSRQKNAVLIFPLRALKHHVAEQHTSLFR